MNRFWALQFPGGWRVSRDQMEMYDIEMKVKIHWTHEKSAEGLLVVREREREREKKKNVTFVRIGDESDNFTNRGNNSKNKMTLQMA